MTRTPTTRTFPDRARGVRDQAARTLAMAALPLTTAAVTLGGLLIWVDTGQAGTPAEIRITSGHVFLPILPDHPRTSAFFTIENRGGSEDRLLSVDVPRDVGVAMLSQDVHKDGAGSMAMIPSLPVNAGERLEMSPFTSTIMLDLTRPLKRGEQIEFVLRFHHSGKHHASATVSPPSDRP